RVRGNVSRWGEEAKQVDLAIRRRTESRGAVTSLMESPLPARAGLSGEKLGDARRSAGVVDLATRLISARHRKRRSVEHNLVPSPGGAPPATFRVCRRSRRVGEG